ncbi:bifunctional DNA primase/polymerase [Streptomyces alfalfae]|uniref:Bifunctional DNA primase/polymerase n=1 Tax=Streptomyces alfalfae TaxID=1642299 RepID=A0A7T4TYT7_9ACTN|nr:bifunctional DNA primase/polymerase [Streptomyces alfalfae]QQC90048.1 bifunctional DNA primase/polymerase [Streptomyces alfalfae]
MTQPPLLRRERGNTSGHLHTALGLAADGLPVLPLRKGKVPFANCPACLYTACGGRPHMKTAGPCTCPSPCHGWAAATTDPAVIASGPWRHAWKRAGAVAYHPGGADLTVVDLDNADAIAWAREHLPATRTVATTRGEHWLYRGPMPSANAVRPGVDIKSTMAYVRWLGPGTGTMAALPDAVRMLPVKRPAAVRPAAVTAPFPSGGGTCRHRTPAFLERGIAMAEQRITQARSGVHSTVYRTFLAVLSTHGRCGCLGEDHMARLFAAAQAKGETARHCAEAWTNARTALGL